MVDFKIGDTVKLNAAALKRNLHPSEHHTGTIVRIQNINSNAFAIAYVRPNLTHVEDGGINTDWIELAPTPEAINTSSIESLVPCGSLL